MGLQVPIAGCTRVVCLMAKIRPTTTGSSPGGESSFSSDFSCLRLSLKPVNIKMTWGSPRASLYVKCVGYSEGCVPPTCVDSQEV